MENESIIKKVKQSTGLSGTIVEQVLNEIINLGTLDLIKTGQFKVTRLGTFTAKTSEACVKRNPATGGKVQVPKKTRVRFKASSILFNSLNVE